MGRGDGKWTRTEGGSVQACIHYSGGLVPALETYDAGLLGVRVELWGDEVGQAPAMLTEVALKVLKLCDEEVTLAAWANTGGTTITSGPYTARLHGPEVAEWEPAPESWNVTWTGEVDKFVDTLSRVRLWMAKGSAAKFEPGVWVHVDSDGAKMAASDGASLYLETLEGGQVADGADGGVWLSDRAVKVVMAAARAFKHEITTVEVSVGDSGIGSVALGPVTVTCHTPNPLDGTTFLAVPAMRASAWEILRCGDWWLRATCKARAWAAAAKRVKAVTKTTSGVELYGNKGGRLVMQVNPHPGDGLLNTLVVSIDDSEVIDMKGPGEKLGAGYVAKVARCFNRGEFEVRGRTQGIYVLGDGRELFLRGLEKK